MASPTSGFWNAGPGGSGDGPIGGYTRQNWNDLFRRLFTRQTANEGVLPGVDGELAVSGTATPLSVASGAGMVYGWWFVDPTATSVAISTPAATAGGRINVRADWAAQTVRIVAVQAASGVTTPPALVQTAGTTWDIPLATYQVTNTGVITVTDARQYNHMATRVNAAMIDPGVALANLGPDSVDDTIVGNRVPQFIRRQGGSATNWQTPGTTAYTPGMVRMQAGAMTSGPTNSTLVTFPLAFSAIPLVTATIASPGLVPYIVMIATVSASSVAIAVLDTSGSPVNGVTVNWLAIGTE